MTQPHDDSDAPILELKGLRTYFFTDQGVVRSVDGVSYAIPRGQTLGVVGESGCGKSVTSLSIMGLVPSPPGRIVGGAIRFEGRDLTKLREPELRAIRGNAISMIFQEPMTSLNPVYTVGDQIIEAIMLHERVEYEEARAKTLKMLEKVGILLRLPWSFDFFFAVTEEVAACSEVAAAPCTTQI